MNIFVDIDGTICKTEGNDYKHSVPISVNIHKINEFFNEGHKIVYWTTRGSTSGKDWYSFTEAQIKSWGCKYDELRMDKPAFDLFIDDRTKRIEEI